MIWNYAGATVFLNFYKYLSLPDHWQSSLSDHWQHLLYLYSAVMLLLVDIDNKTLICNRPCSRVKIENLFFAASLKIGNLLVWHVQSVWNLYLFTEQLDCNCWDLPIQKILSVRAVKARRILHYSQNSTSSDSHFTGIVDFVPSWIGSIVIDLQSLIISFNFISSKARTKIYFTFKLKAVYWFWSNVSSLSRGD